jgi:hypothetical protein
LDGARLLKQAGILCGFGGYERRYANGAVAAVLGLYGAGGLGREAGCSRGRRWDVEALELGQGRGYTVSAHGMLILPQQHTPKSQLGGRVSARLVVADETQDLAEAGHGEQAAVLRVCNLPYLAQYRRRKLGALKELDGDLARDDTELLRVGLLEEELEDALLLGREVEDGLVCALY